MKALINLSFILFLHKIYGELPSLKTLTYASFIASLLVLISGILFLTIIILDEDIDVEIAFN